MLISELMSAEFPAELAMTRKLLAKILNDKLAWKPAEALHTIGWNAAHLADIVGWLPGIVKESEFDICPGGEAFVSPETTDTAQLLQAFDGNATSALAAPQGVPDSMMDEPWSLKMAGQTLFTMKKGDCLRKWVFAHSAHHRGILSVYLRMAGVACPSIDEE